MAYEKVTVNGKERLRFIPAGSTRIKHKDGLAVAFVYDTAGRMAVIGYVGNSAKSAFHYTFKTADKAAKYVADFFAGMTAHKAAKDARRKAASAPHALTVGDVITNSWGYDQTNVDWYRVARTSRSYVWLQPIASVSRPEESCGPMSGMTTAAVDTTSLDPSQWSLVDLPKKMQKHRAEGTNVTMQHGIGSKWDGQPKYESWYA